MYACVILVVSKLSNSNTVLKLNVGGLSSCYCVSLVRFSYWSKFHVNTITGSDNIRL